MNKFISAFIALTMTTSIFAAQTVVLNKHLSMEWSLEKASDRIDLTNNTEITMNVYLAVKQIRDSVAFGVPSDPIRVSGCAGGDTDVNPGSFIACQIPAMHQAHFHIKPDAFKNGSAGTYSTQ